MLKDQMDKIKVGDCSHKAQPISCAIHAQRLVPSLLSVMACIVSAIFGKFAVVAKNSKTGSVLEPVYFYAFFQNASYPRYTSYKSNLLVTSYGECIDNTGTPQSITSIPLFAKI